MTSSDMAIEADMAYRLYNACLGYTDGVSADLLDKLESIARDRHCGNGYYSWDGMLDDLTDLVGDSELASEILNNC